MTSTLAVPYPYIQGNYRFVNTSYRAEKAHASRRIRAVREHLVSTDCVVLGTAAQTSEPAGTFRAFRASGPSDGPVRASRSQLLLKYRLGGGGGARGGSAATRTSDAQPRDRTCLARSRPRGRSQPDDAFGPQEVETCRQEYHSQMRESIYRWRSATRRRQRATATERGMKPASDAALAPPPGQGPVITWAVRPGPDRGAGPRSGTPRFPRCPRRARPPRPAPGS